MVDGNTIHTMYGILVFNIWQVDAPTKLRDLTPSYARIIRRTILIKLCPLLKSTISCLFLGPPPLAWVNKTFFSWNSNCQCWIFLHETYVVVVVLVTQWVGVSCNPVISGDIRMLSHRLQVNIRGYSLPCIRRIILHFWRFVPIVLLTVLGHH